MSKQFENIDDLLGKYLAGEASPNEAQLVEVWVKESETNQKYFDQLQMIFAKAAAVHELQQFNTDVAWDKVKANLSKPSGKSRTLHNDWKNAYRIAASVIIVLGIGLYFFVSNRSDGLKPTQVVATTQAISDTLPDGSAVFLNKKTKINYAFNKKKERHEVNLKGEAYFSVDHGNDATFLIDAGGVYVRDIGTSFNVKAYPDSDIVEVLVEEGEVVFFTNDNPGLHLKASGKGVYNKKTKSFTIEQPEPNILAYKTRFFMFSGTPLGELAAQVNGVYNTKIVVPDHLKNCLLTVSFRNEHIEEIAAVISETLNLQVTTSGDTIHLSGDGCQ
ncbi:MAG TPA: FecR family protein [Ohtaekwangia sp.]|nr:FecR family protein [Ohtaekwangia sp.]